MSLAQSLESLRKVNFSELDANNLGSWPAPVKVVAAILLLIAVLALGYNFHLKDLQGQLEQQRSQEESLKQQFATKAFEAANLEKYRQQMAEMEQSVRCLAAPAAERYRGSGAAGGYHAHRAGQRPRVRGNQADARSHPAVLHRAGRSRSVWWVAITIWPASSAAWPACRGSSPCTISKSSRWPMVAPS